MDKAILGKVKNAMLAMQRLPWEQGVAGQACFLMGDKNMGTLIAREAVHRQIWDGRLANIYFTNPCTDPGANGEPVLDAYDYTGEEIFKIAAEKQVEWFLHRAPRSHDGVIYFELNRAQIIADAPYMITPFLAKAGEYKAAIDQIEGFRHYLLDDKTKLYWQMWSEETKSYCDSRFWGGGNGWFVGAIAKTHNYLPESMKLEKKKLAGYLQELVDAYLKYQRTDGLFHDTIDDSGTFVETNSSFMLSYAIYCGIKGGALSKTYLAPAHKMRIAANERIDKNGLIQQTASMPTWRAPGTSVEAQAFCIMSNCSAEEFE